MVSEKEIAEYHNLCTALSALHGKFQEKKLELRRLLEETAALRKNAFLALARANRLTGHLTSRQRQIAGLSYHLNEIKARIKKVNQSSLVLLRKENGNEAAVYDNGLLTEGNFPEDCRNQRELKQKVLLLLKLIDNLKKNILQLELLELRCKELILSIGKAMEAFRHESKSIRRKLYPFGFFSLLRRFLRFLFGKDYFSSGDLSDISALGNITGFVLKIADSPLF